ncbi:MAG TPA: Hpt domain-containing protein [Terriglobales bacterium]|nr:Hpt domain-containing protein [Terriglobales bacterium]
MDDLLERIDGDRTLLAELVEMLRKDYRMQFQAARVALSKNDSAGIQRIGHALKGAMSNLAAPLASTMARDLESCGRTGDLSSVGELLTQLEHEMGRVAAKLESLCPELV